MLPDGTFRVKFVYEIYDSSTTFSRVDVGTYTERPSGTYQFTVTESTIVDPDSINQSPSVVGSTFVVSVGADGLISGYPEQRIDYGGSLGAPSVTEDEL